MECMQFIKYVELAGYEVRDYSGRGMNGDRCVGVTTDDSEAKVITSIISSVSECEDFDDPNETLDFIFEFCTVLSAAKSDSMGRSSIVYWPNVKWNPS